MRWFELNLPLVVSDAAVAPQRHPTVTTGQEFMIFCQ
jgi:hypothetical protein